MQVSRFTPCSLPERTGVEQPPSRASSSRRAYPRESCRLSRCDLLPQVTRFSAASARLTVSLMIVGCVSAGRRARCPPSGQGARFGSLGCSVLLGLRCRSTLLGTDDSLPQRDLTLRIETAAEALD